MAPALVFLHSAPRDVGLRSPHELTQPFQASLTKLWSLLLLGWSRTWEALGEKAA